MPVVLGDRPSSLEPPAHLSERAVATWHELTAPVLMAGLLQDSDLPAFAMMAEALAEYRALQAEVDGLLDRGRGADGLTYHVGTNGAVAVYPVVGLRDKARDAYLKLAARFGGTPSDRVALGLNTVKGRKLGNALADKIGTRPGAPPPSDVIDATP